ncbi:hypothetical protein Hanom_Chr02g00140531 [Helianthus anomalus]
MLWTETTATYRTCPTLVVWVTDVVFIYQMGSLTHWTNLFLLVFVSSLAPNRQSVAVFLLRSSLVDFFGTFLKINFCENLILV